MLLLASILVDIQVTVCQWETHRTWVSSHVEHQYTCEWDTHKDMGQQSRGAPAHM